MKKLEWASAVDYNNLIFAPLAFDVYGQSGPGVKHFLLGLADLAQEQAGIHPQSFFKYWMIAHSVTLASSVANAINYGAQQLAARLMSIEEEGPNARLRSARVPVEDEAQRAAPTGWTQFQADGGADFSRGLGDHDDDDDAATEVGGARRS